MTIRRRITGLLATLLIATLLIGLPIMLIAVGGNPLPESVPTLADIGGWFTRPDDGRLALQALIVFGWLIWTALSATIISEITAVARGITLPTLPGFAIPQLAVRQLVAAAALLFISAQTLPGVPVAHADDTNTPPASASTESPETPIASANSAAGETPALIDHTVQPADTLTGLAQTYLGDADRWPEIFDATTPVVQPDGQQITNPDLIRDGWTVKIPTATTTATAADRVIEHTVIPTDTLSGLAETFLGDADRWPEIFDATTPVVQADGLQLTDPDLLLPGWRILIPAPAAVSLAAPTSNSTGTVEEEDTSAVGTQTDSGDTSEYAPAQVPTAETPGTVPSASQKPTEQQSETTNTSDEAEQHADVNNVEPNEFPWMLTGFSTGGAVLATAALAALRARRHQQFRERQPGRAIAPVEPRLAPVEKSITVVGTTSAPTVHFMDQALRHLGATMTSQQIPMPKLAAVELQACGALAAHLAEPTQLSDPWFAVDSSELVWRLNPDANVDITEESSGEQLAPYPLLVTCGSTSGGDLWLVNLEQVGTIHVEGDPDYRSDYLRYVVAELAINQWSANTTITCTGIDDLTDLNPERIRTAASLNEAIQTVTDHAVETVASTTRLEADAVTARTGQIAEEVWPAQVLIAGNLTDRVDNLTALSSLITAHPGQTAAAVIVDATPSDASRFIFTGSGRVKVADLGLDLIAVGLTRDEAIGCAQLLSVGTSTQDAPMPSVSDTDGWQGLADQSGALREDLTLSRAASDMHAVASLICDDLPLPASATDDDVETLDPKVPDKVPVMVEDADPDLDQDVADWMSNECRRPRLTLLGPVQVRAHGAAIAKRKPFYTEVLSYLALREHGATPDELATALGYTNLTTVRTAVKTVRDWLGTNPHTGRPHLPAATESKAAHQRGVPTYEVEDLLIDIDLFRRLRLRGQSRGKEGVDDHVSALGLVTGRPFDQLRPGGWSWLVDTSIDHHMTCAIVDVAHLLASHFIQTVELDRAQAVTETALLAAPYDEIPKLDMAAILKAQGHDEESHRIIDHDICNVPDDTGLPADVGGRTERILAGEKWRQAYRQFAS